MSADYSALIMFGVALSKDEINQIYKAREIEYDGFTEFDIIQNKVVQNRLTLVENNYYYEIPDHLVLGKVLEATDEIEIINRNRFLGTNSDLAQKIYDVYKEVFNKELELERLNFVLIERIW